MKIFGRIQDAKTGEPLVGVNVYVSGPDGRPIITDNGAIGTATDNDGEYLIDNAPDDTQLIAASYIGYRTRVHDVRRMASPHTIMLPAEDYEIPTVEITAARPRAEKSQDWKKYVIMAGAGLLLIAAVYFLTRNRPGGTGARTAV